MVCLSALLGKIVSCIEWHWSGSTLADTDGCDGEDRFVTCVRVVVSGQGRKSDSLVVCGEGEREEAWQRHKKCAEKNPVLRHGCCYERRSLATDSLASCPL
jgi:hypothetical protein